MLGWLCLASTCTRHHLHTAALLRVLIKQLSSQTNILFTRSISASSPPQCTLLAFVGGLWSRQQSNPPAWLLGTPIPQVRMLSASRSSAYSSWHRESSYSPSIMRMHCQLGEIHCGWFGSVMLPNFPHTCKHSRHTEEAHWQRYTGCQHLQLNMYKCRSFCFGINLVTKSGNSTFACTLLVTANSLATLPAWCHIVMPAYSSGPK